MSPSQAFVFLDSLCSTGYVIDISKTTAGYFVSAHGPIRAVFGAGADLASAIDDLKKSASRKPHV